jgi:NTP pyrophosphatase (non-canonical NTP hydrolase)
MDPKEYEQNCLITESKEFTPIHDRINDRMIRILHAGLGMSSELSELTDAAYSATKENEVDWVNVSEESADILWYCSIGVNSLGFDQDEISSFETDPLPASFRSPVHDTTILTAAIAAITCSVGEFNDQIKKHMFYGRKLNKEKMKQSLQQICMGISGICIVSGTTISDARQTNINKLKARYGEKFSEAAALNRNLEVERKILEDGVKV